MSHPYPSGKRKQAPRPSMLADAAPRVLRPAPLRQAVYDAIVELIVHGTLERGRHVVEAELADYLGVSRQPVREALQRLQTDGWIEFRPGQGAFVHIPSEEEVDQLLAVRSVLETHSAGLAAERATPEDVNRLWELQQDGLNALAANDSEGLVAMPDGSFWVSDEYGPFITHFDGNGRQLDRLSPFDSTRPDGRGLPKISDGFSIDVEPMMRKSMSPPPSTIAAAAAPRKSLSVAPGTARSTRARMAFSQSLPALRMQSSSSSL